MYVGGPYIHPDAVVQQGHGRNIDLVGEAGGADDEGSVKDHAQGDELDGEVGLDDLCLPPVTTHSTLDLQKRKQGTYSP